MLALGRVSKLRFQGSSSTALQVEEANKYWWIGELDPLKQFLRRECEAGRYTPVLRRGLR